MRKISLITAIIIVILSITMSISFISYLSPPKDKIESFNYPLKFFCANTDNYIDYQTKGKCAAYATSYLLRHFKEEANGEELSHELKRTFGFVSTNSIIGVFRQHGYQAKSYHGNIDTLKQRLIEGHPIIVFIRIPKDTHYAVVIGYDEQNIYLVDSLKENANVSNSQYNRVLLNEEFVNVWKSKTLLPNNIYIVVKTQKDNL